MLLDGREPAEFTAGHVRGALSIGLRGRFEECAGAVLPLDRDVVLVGDSGAMTVLGYPSTVPVSIDEMLMLASAVRRASSANRAGVTTAAGSFTRLRAALLASSDQAVR